MSLPRQLLVFPRALALVLAAGCASEAKQTSELEQFVDPSGHDAGRRDGGRDASVEQAARDAKVPAVLDSGSEQTSCGALRVETQLARGPADIIITLDTSLSMAPQVCNVSTNLTNFAAGVGDSSRVVSVYEMGVLGLATAGLCGTPDPLAATPLASDPDRYLHRAVGVDSWNALSQFDAQYDSYAHFLRPDAPTHIVVVSDDQSDPLRGGLTAADFKARMEQKLGHSFFFHAIVADGVDGCVGSGIGTEYLTLADQTMGEKLSICAADWSVMFAQLEAAVVNSAPIPCAFAIPAPPRGQALDPEAVQVEYEPSAGDKAELPRANSAGKCGSETAWHYDDADDPTRIELCPAACALVEQGGNLSIAFGCAPIFVM
jgi:hypothetical protein